MSKYKKQVAEMLEIHHELFDTFRHVHENYVLNPAKWQQSFNEVGQDALHIIRRYESNLCSRSESGKYGKFSANLADKFWEEIRFHFPKIDAIESV